MSQKLKKQLIKMGSTNPELRPHLRAVLAELDRVPLLRTARDFRSWMQKVDRKIMQTVGMDHRDLPDVPYRDWFDDGMSPSPQLKRHYDVQVGDSNLTERR